MQHQTSQTKSDDEDTIQDDQDVVSDCLICLGTINDRMVLAKCLHSCFCFKCIVKWVELKRHCPLCQQETGAFVIHGIRSDDDYIKYYLRPLPSIDGVLEQHASSSQYLGLGSSASTPSSSNQLGSDEAVRILQQEEELKRAERRRLAFRKQVYRNGWYVKHVGSNRHTHYRPMPTPCQILASDQVQQQLAVFIRRELHAWPDLDIDFLSTYIVSILKTMMLSSDEAVGLLSEFLGPDGARHFAHEVEAFARSGRKRLQDYDQSPWVQYETERPRCFNESSQEANRHPVTSVPPMTNPDDNLSAPSTQTTPPPPPRQEVIDKRAQLLQKLEREKQQLLARHQMLHVSSEWIRQPPPPPSSCLSDTLPDRDTLQAASTAARAPRNKGKEKSPN